MEKGKINNSQPLNRNHHKEPKTAPKPSPNEIEKYKKELKPIIYKKGS